MTPSKHKGADSEDCTTDQTAPDRVSPVLICEKETRAVASVGTVFGHQAVKVDGPADHEADSRCDYRCDRDLESRHRIRSLRTLDGEDPRRRPDTRPGCPESAFLGLCPPTSYEIRRVLALPRRFSPSSPGPFLLGDLVERATLVKEQGVARIVAPEVGDAGSLERRDPDAPTPVLATQMASRAVGENEHARLGPTFSSDR